MSHTVPLNTVRVLITVMLMVVSVVAYRLGGILVAAPFIAGTLLFFLFSFTKVGAISATRRIGRFTFNAIKEEGLKRIRKGTFHVSEESFSSSVEKIKDILSEQQYVPEFGLDGMFLSYGSEAAANNALEEIKARGIKADTLLDRRTWLVKIEFE